MNEVISIICDLRFVLNSSGIKYMFKVAEEWGAIFQKVAKNYRDYKGVSDPSTSAYSKNSHRSKMDPRRILSKLTSRFAKGGYARNEGGFIAYIVLPLAAKGRNSFPYSSERRAEVVSSSLHTSLH